MVKYCPKCGYPNPDEAMYCVRCGIPLGTVQPQSQLSPQQQINNPQQAPQYQQTTPKYPQQQYQTPPSSLNSIKTPQQTDYVSFYRFTFVLCLLTAGVAVIITGSSVNSRALIYGILFGIFSLIIGFTSKIALVNIIYQGGQLSIYNESVSEADFFVTCLNKAKMGEFNCTKGS
jgi:hypothetical protein